MLKKSNVLCCGGLQVLNPYPPSRTPPSRPAAPGCSRPFQSCRLYATVQEPSDADLSWPNTSRFTPYDIFRQERGAPYSKSRFYDLVKIYHPDRPCHGHPLCNDISHEVRLQRYRLIVSAHEILSDPNKRAAYDQFGLGWHDHPDHSNPTPPRYRTGVNYDDPIYANATWEDWERWYNRDNPKQRNEVDHRTFATFIILLAMFGGAMQASWLGQFTTGFDEKLRDMNEQSTRFLTGRRRQTTDQLSSSEARVQHFLIKRDPSGSGLKEGEEEVYKKVLDPRSRAPLAQVESLPSSPNVVKKEKAINEGS